MLSHNALAGKDDPYILKELYDKILDLNWKEYSGLDDKTLELLDKMTADATWLTKRSQYDDWLDAQENIQASYNVKNVATAVDIILKIFKQNITQLQESYSKSEDDKKWIPIETVIGRNKIPAGSAKKIAKAVQKIQGIEKLKETELWRTLEILSEKYLAGE